MFKHYNIDGNKEMVAIGTMNMVGSCFSCYLTTGKHKHKHKQKRKPTSISQSIQLPLLRNSISRRPIFAIGRELQCRMQNGGFEHRNGDCSDVDAAVLDSPVPLHSSRGAFFHHHFGHAWPHRLRGRHSLVEGR